MPDFNYTACDQTGARLTGTISAANRRDAAAALAGKSLFPLTMEDARPMAAPQKLRRVPASLLAVTYGQLADLLRSGVPLLRALTVVEKQTSQPGLKSVLEEVRRQVEDGKTLSDAMSRFQNVFGEMAVSMVRAGGEGGFLEEALTRVAAIHRKPGRSAEADDGRRGLSDVSGRRRHAHCQRAGDLLRAQVRRPLRQPPQGGRIFPWSPNGCLNTSAALRSWPAVFIAAAVFGGGLVGASLARN